MVLLLLIALVLAYFVGQVHLAYLIRIHCPTAWLALQMERAWMEAIKNEAGCKKDDKN